MLMFLSLSFCPSSPLSLKKKWMHNFCGGSEPPYIFCRTLPNPTQKKLFFSNSSPKDMSIDFYRERKAGGKEKEGETSSWVRNAAFCMHPKQGSNLQPRHVPWPGIEPPTFCYMGWGSNQMSQTGQSWTSIFRFWRHLRKVLQYAWEKVLFKQINGH